MENLQIKLDEINRQGEETTKQINSLKTALEEKVLAFNALKAKKELLVSLINEKENA